MNEHIRIPRRFAAAASIVALAALPTPAFAGFVTGGTMTLTLTAHTASALSHGGVLIYPVGPVTVKGSSAATGDRHSHVAVVKISPSFTVAFPLTGGSTSPSGTFVSSDGGLGFASIVHGQAVTLTQFQARLPVGSGAFVFARFNSFEYTLASLVRVDRSHIHTTTTAAGTTITGLRATLTGFAAQALNQALQTSAFSSGSTFGTISIRTRES